MKRCVKDQLNETWSIVSDMNVLVSAFLRLLARNGYVSIITLILDPYDQNSNYSCWVSQIIYNTAFGVFLPYLEPLFSCFVLYIR